MADAKEVAAGLTKALLKSHSFTSSRDNRGVAYVQLFFHGPQEREEFLDAYIAALRAQVTHD